MLATVLTLARYPLILRPTGRESPEFLRMIANWNLPRYAIWFIGGILAESYLVGFRAGLAHRRRELIAGAAVVGALGFAESEWVRRASGRDWLSPEATLLNTVFVGLLLLALLAVEGKEPRFAGRVRTLGTMSFGVYLMHVPILEVVARGIYHVMPQLLGMFVLLYAILVISGVGVPVTAMYVARRTPLRRLYPFFFG